MVSRESSFARSPINPWFNFLILRRRKLNLFSSLCKVTHEEVGRSWRPGFPLNIAVNSEDTWEEEDQLIFSVLLIQGTGDRYLKALVLLIVKCLCSFVQHGDEGNEGF